MDSLLLRDWIEGRSLARGLPPPCEDRGGWRVDTGAPDETCRWMFAQLGPGTAELAAEFDRPGHLLKACVGWETLRAALPARWAVEHTGYFMRAAGAWESLATPAGYRLEIERNAGVATTRLWTAAGELAASGHGGQTTRAFVYDRIVTAEAHRRRGLGRAVMTALREVGGRAGVPELLVATDDGRALYETLGWQVLAPYSTAFVSGSGDGATA